MTLMALVAGVALVLGTCVVFGWGVLAVVGCGLVGGVIVQAIVEALARR